MASLQRASTRLSAALASTFWPTMITDNRTSWRKVWDTHDAEVTALCEVMAEGRLTSARAAKAEAHHSALTPFVTLMANHELNRATGFPCGSCSLSRMGGATWSSFSVETGFTRLGAAGLPWAALLAAPRAGGRRAPGVRSPGDRMLRGSGRSVTHRTH